jgi:hypothetical protein
LRNPCSPRRRIAAGTGAQIRAIFGQLFKQSLTLQFQFVMQTKNPSRRRYLIVTHNQYTNQVSGATAADSSGVPIPLPVLVNGDSPDQIEMLDAQTLGDYLYRSLFIAHQQVPDTPSIVGGFAIDETCHLKEMTYLPIESQVARLPRGVGRLATAT